MDLKSRPKVLLVESDYKSRLHHTYMLMQNSYMVKTTTRVSEALSTIITGNCFDCVLVDDQHLGLDLFDFLQTIWKYQSRLPIVVMTSNHAHMELAKETQADEWIWFLKKPCSVSQICNILQNVCSKRLTSSSNSILQGQSISSRFCGSLSKQTATCTDISSDIVSNTSKSIYSSMTKTEDEGKQPMGVKTQNTKTRITWTPRLHGKCMEALAALRKKGVNPTAKKVLKYMNTPGLTRTQVASHLQIINEKEKATVSPMQSTNLPMTSTNSIGIPHMIFSNINSILAETGQQLTSPHQTNSIITDSSANQETVHPSAGNHFQPSVTDVMSNSSGLFDQANRDCFSLQSEHLTGATSTIRGDEVIDGNIFCTGFDNTDFLGAGSWAVSEAGLSINDLSEIRVSASHDQLIESQYSMQKDANDFDNAILVGAGSGTVSEPGLALFDHSGIPVSASYDQLMESQYSMEIDGNIFGNGFDNMDFVGAGSCVVSEACLSLNDHSTIQVSASQDPVIESQYSMQKDSNGFDSAIFLGDGTCAVSEPGLALFDHSGIPVSASYGQVMESHYSMLRNGNIFCNRFDNMDFVGAGSCAVSEAGLSFIDHCGIQLSTSHNQAMESDANIFSNGSEEDLLLFEDFEFPDLESHDEGSDDFRQVFQGNTKSSFEVEKNIEDASASFSGEQLGTQLSPCLVGNRHVSKKSTSSSRKRPSTNSSTYEDATTSTERDDFASSSHHTPQHELANLLDVEMQSDNNPQSGFMDMLMQYGCLTPNGNTQMPSTHVLNHPPTTEVRVHCTPDRRAIVDPEVPIQLKKVKKSPREFQLLVDILSKCVGNNHMIVNHSPVGMYPTTVRDDIPYIHLLQLFCHGWLDITIIHWFEMFLHRSQNCQCVFLNPHHIKGYSCEKNPDYVSDYIFNMIRLNVGKKFIVAPFLAKRHWTLLIFSGTEKCGYIIDSMKGNNDKDHYILVTLIEKALGFKLHWEMAQCKQQMDTWECGYMVIRHMVEFVSTIQYDYPAKLWNDMGFLPSKEIDQMIVELMPHFIRRMFEQGHSLLLDAGFE